MSLVRTDKQPARYERLRILWAQYREARTPDAITSDGSGHDIDNWMQCPNCSPDVTAPGDCYTVGSDGRCCTECGGTSMLRPPTLVPDVFEADMMVLEAILAT